MHHQAASVISTSQNLSNLLAEHASTNNLVNDLLTQQQPASTNLVNQASFPNSNSNSNNNNNNNNSNSNYIENNYFLNQQISSGNPNDLASSVNQSSSTANASSSKNSFPIIFCKIIQNNVVFLKS